MLLPALLLAGAYLAPPKHPGEWWLLGLAMLARISVTFVAGQLLGFATRHGRGALSALALGLLSPGTLSVIVGFGLFLRFRGEAGSAILSAAFLATLLGELLGAPRLRRALTLAGELAAEPVTIRPPPAPMPTEGAS